MFFVRTRYSAVDWLRNWCNWRSDSLGVLGLVCGTGGGLELEPDVTIAARSRCADTRDDAARRSAPTAYVGLPPSLNAHTPVSHTHTQPVAMIGNYLMINILQFVCGLAALMDARLRLRT